MASSNSTLPGWCGFKDDSFGPTVEGCRGNFDFTLLFEESILSILPSAILLLLVPARLFQLSRSQKKVRHSLLQLTKLINCILYFSLQIELLVRWARPHALRTRLSVATAAIGMIDAVAIGVLSFFDHNRSVRPSTILQIFLSTSLLFDIARARTLWLLSPDNLLVRVFTTAVVSKAIMLFLELAEKRHGLEASSKTLPRETTSGFANIRIFWWLNHLLRTGARQLLGIQDIDDVEADFRSDALLEELQGNWLKVDKPQKHALLLTTAKTFKRSLLAGVIPRLCLSGFTYTQPFLINTLINYVDAPVAGNNVGYALIGAYVLVFFGAAVSSSHYEYETLRAATKIRGGLVTIIYSTTQDLHITSINENAAATLMSTDVERIARSMQMFHNFWATPLELGAAIYLLERQIGVPCIVVVVLAIGCSFASMALSPKMGKAQQAWLEAIQKRLNVTTRMLGSMKEVKMTGLTDLVSSFIQQTRIDEIKASFPFRRIIVWSVAISEFDPRWYETVLNACALAKDIEELPLGDQTILGSRGIAVSGGQKQRIAIARAIYSRKEIAVFDDVMTGLDASTEEHVFNQVFGPLGLFRNLGTTVILVTHKVRRLSSADHIIAIGQSRKISEQGDFAQLKSAEGYLSRLLVQGDESEESPAQEEFTSQKKTAGKSATAVTTTFAQLDSKRQTGDLSTYSYFFQAAGRFPVILAFVLAAVNVSCTVYSTLWVQRWVQVNQSAPNKDVALYMCVYALLGVTSLVTLWIWSWLYVNIVIPRAGRSLHKSLLQSTLRAPLSFLTMTDTGVMINRFSQDLQLVDSTLQQGLINTIEALFQAIIQLVIVCVTAKYFAATIPFALFAVYFIQKYYLRTSRQLRLLDIETKAPLYSHFIETLSGLATNRAYGWQSAMQKQNHGLMDAAQKPFYNLACIQKWLEFVLNILTAVLTIIVVVFAVTLKGNMNGAETGVAMVNVFNTNVTLVHLIVAWTSLETAIGAVARIRSFTQDTPSEVRSDIEELNVETWPSAGAISFDGVTASYSSNSPAVLKDINMSISAGEKIGICGRTGSGKSSTILCLLQMLSLHSGSIKIDGIDLSTLSREAVRSNLITISQDAVFIEGTIRLNVDPHSLTSDEAIISALKSVQLWNVIQEKGGLDARSADVNLSHGQQQLFCLARAIIRKGKVLLLDEATSSIDSETNKIIQSLIRNEFKDYTIISVEHTLENILDFDRIAVFDTGALVEFDSPRQLSGRPSAFRTLYTRGGS